MSKLVFPNIIFVLLVFTLTFSSCETDEIIEPEKIPSVDNSNNNSLSTTITDEDAKFIMTESLKNSSHEFTANLFDMAVQMITSLKAEDSVDHNSEEENVSFDFTCDSLMSFKLFSFAYDEEFGLVNSDFNSDLSY